MVDMNFSFKHELNTPGTEEIMEGDMNFFFQAWEGGGDKIFCQNTDKNYIFLVLEKGDMEFFCAQEGGDEKNFARNKKSSAPQRK